MVYTPKQFAEKLNQCLDENDAPHQVRERANVLSKMVDIPKHHARSLVEGQQLPDDELAAKLCNEFDVEVEWLIGKKLSQK